MDRPQRRESPNSPSSPTFEKFLREKEGPWRTMTSSAKEDHGHHHQIKKSVLAKVRDKAKKLRHSLSIKKRHHEDENTTPAWGISLEDEEDEEEEDPEYLGAPMYESELAPECYKETARQHPRTIPVILDKHVLPRIASEDEKNNEDPLSPANSTKPTQTQDHDKLSSTSTPQKTITETVSQKLAPALETVTSTVSEATHSITSKIQGLVLNSTTEPNNNNNNNNNNNKNCSQVAPPSSSSAQISPQTSSEAGKNVSSGGDQRMWDKGVSVKEYLLNKFEPGEEDRALSQAISDAVSPITRKAPGDHQTSVVDVVREAVTSLLRNNDQAHSSPSKPAALTRAPTKASSHSTLPISTNAHEAEEEQNPRRILQTN